MNVSMNTNPQSRTKNASVDTREIGNRAGEFGRRNNQELDTEVARRNRKQLKVRSHGKEGPCVRWWRRLPVARGGLGRRGSGCGDGLILRRRD